MDKKQARAKYMREWYKKNAAAHKARTRSYRRRKHKEWREFKATFSCFKCGFSHPAAIDFHHVESSVDNTRVNELISDGRYTAAYKEIKEKCIPLCCNCHRILHWKEKK